MRETYKKYPFWRSCLHDVEETLDSAKRGSVHMLCESAGGQRIRYITYGEKVDYERYANYSSACACFQPERYAQRNGKRPTILLFGGTHGQETEGIVGLLNLISILENGHDLRGIKMPLITELYQKYLPRLILIPVYNVDGRRRCEVDSMLDEPYETLRYYGQGTWKDGSLCGWPDCKKTHPIKEYVDFLGAYFNDNGVNLFQDNFMSPMAEETKALMKLCDSEAPDCVIGLHGGGCTTNVLLQPDYVPQYIREAVYRLAQDVAWRQQKRGLPYQIEEIKGIEDYPPPPFNLTNAIHHVCGAVSSTYESNEGLISENKFTAEEILIHHYCLFESVLSLAWQKKE